MTVLPQPGGTLARVGAAVIVGVVAVLSLTPHLAVPDQAPRNTDLAIHLVMQGSLGFCVIYAWPRAMRWTLLVLCGLVIGLEVGQIWVPGREFSWPDLLSNALGAALGAGLAFIVARGFRRA